jgi:hypothetical protein
MAKSRLPFGLPLPISFFNSFPEELKARLLDVYGEEPFPYSWTEQDIYKGSRKMLTDYFNNKSN